MHRFFFIIMLLLLFPARVYCFDSLPFTGDKPRYLMAIDDNTLIIGNAWGGIYRLDLTTNSWFLPEFGPDCFGGDLNITSLATPYSGSDTVLASTGVGYQIMPDDFPRAVISLDGGDYWQSVSGIPDPFWHKSNAVSYDPFHPDTALWAGSHNYLYRSIDAGITWFPLSDTLNFEQKEITWDRNNPGVVFLGTLAHLEVQPGWDNRRGILRSTDSGETWNLVWSPEAIGRNTYVNTIVQDPFDPQLWMVALEMIALDDEEWSPCLLISEDGGLSWYPWQQGIPGVWRIQDICADPEQPGRYWIAHNNRGVFRTEDYGATWMEENAGFFAWTSPMSITKVGIYVYALNRKDAVYRKRPGDDVWTMLQQNPFDQSAPAMREYLVNGTIYGTGYIGCYALSVWPEVEFAFWGQPLPDVNPEHIAIDPNNTNRRSILTNVKSPDYFYGVFVTEDGGETWEAWGGGGLMQDAPDDCAFLNSDTLVVVENLGIRHVTAQDNEVVYSYPDGYNVKNSLQYGQFLVLLASTGVRYSTDGGRTFSLSSLDVSPSQIAGDPRPGQQLLISTVSRCYRSWDTGATWEMLPPVPSIYINGLACYDSLIYAACQWDSTIYVRIEDQPWQSYMGGIPHGYYAASSLHAGEHGIVARNASHRPNNTAFFYAPHFTSDVNEGWQPLHLGKPLITTYPNPFNDFTTVNVSLPKPVKIRLTIHDLLGREVAVLKDAHLSAGNYSIPWDASGQASGSYFLKLVTDDKSISHRITLVR